jgi:hypothetical protein
VYKEIKLPVKRVQVLVYDATCCWSDIVLNVHVPTENESDDKTNNFYEKLEVIFDQFSAQHMN